MKKWVGTLCLLCCALATLAQPADSLVNLLKAAKPDTNRVNLLIQAFRATRDLEPDKAALYVDEAITLSRKLDFNSGMLRSYREKGVMLGIQGNYNEALRILNIGFNMARQQNNKGMMGLYAMNIGTVYYDKGQFKDALQNLQNAVKWREEAKDDKGVADTYIWLGIVVERGFKDLPKALEHYRSALNVFLRLNDEQGMTYSYSNMGNVYITLRQYDSALHYQFKALVLKEKQGSPVSLGISYNNIGNIYTDLKQYDKAFEYYTKSLQYRQQAGDLNGIATSYVNIAAVYGHQKKIKEALAYGLKGVETASEAGASQVLMTAYELMSELHEEQGDMKSSLMYRKQFDKLKDSVYNADLTAQMAEMETRFETERKELELNKANLQLSNTQLELSRKRIQNIALICAIVGIVVLGYLLYNRYRLQQRQKLDAELLKQQELRNKAIIEAEERERIRIAKDLHDGVGQQIAAVKMSLSVFKDNIKGSMDVEDKYAAIVDMADEAVKEVRAVSHNMMPNALLRFGFATAVREFIDKIAANGLLKCNLEMVGLNERLDTTTETVLYRVLQECVSNIIKHAAATQVTIQIIKDEEQLTLMIEDNGKGFNSADVNKFTGIGLKNIVSRVQYLKGTVDFDSHVGKGTTVVIEVPLAA